MFPAIFANLESQCADLVQKAEARLYTDYILPLAFILFLLAGEALLFVLWGLYRRFFPGKPDETRVPLACVGLLFVGQPLILFGWKLLRDAWTNANPILLADIVATVHFVFVKWVVAQQLLIFLGGALGWRWVRNFWMRLFHLASMTLVASQALLGVWCPLTVLEEDLRGDSKESREGASAIGDFCSRGLVFLGDYGDHGAFAVAYALFAAFIVLGWAVVRPDWPWGGPLPPQPPEKP